MNYSVWKYELDTNLRGTEHDCVVQIREPADILTAAFQGPPVNNNTNGFDLLPRLVVWARVDTDVALRYAVRFRMVETGPAPDTGWYYLATAAYDGYVLHVFYRHG